MADCLLSAMESAGIAPTDVEYINAHGTSTPLNDKFETMAYKRCAGSGSSARLPRGKPEACSRELLLLPELRLLRSVC